MSLDELIAELQLVRAQYGGDIAAWQTVGSPPLSIEVVDLYPGGRLNDRPEKVVVIG